MLTRLVKLPNESYRALYQDGTFREMDKPRRFLENCMNPEWRHDGTDGRWDGFVLDMSEVPGTTAAYVNSMTPPALVIFDTSILFDGDEMSCQYVTAAEYAEIYGVSVEAVKRYCREGRIAGVQKCGGTWIIPRSSGYPVDNRRRDSDVRRMAVAEFATDGDGAPLTDSSEDPEACVELDGQEAIEGF